MRLTVPEPKIDLYNDGFADHDQLGRKATGDKLSDLVERIDDPMALMILTLCNHCSTVKIPKRFSGW